MKTTSLSPLTIGEVTVESTAGVSRVWANVDGEPLWFECSDATLRPAPEAFAGAMILPSLMQRRRLVMDAPVCPHWHANLPAILRLFHQWWNYSELMPSLTAGATFTTPRASLTGLCFSGGVDSFFSLLRYQPKVDVLVYVHDYDIPIRGHGREPRFELWLRRVADRVGRQPVLVRTNLKRHPVFARVSWIAAHGAGLAAVGHVLSDLVGTLVVSSTYPYTAPHSGGTHWELDPLWSSSRLRVVHFGATHSRSEKLREMAAHPLVREHLRPCWENFADRQNCSECEKCVRTQLVLLQCGELSRSAAFTQTRPLVERIDRLRRIPTIAVIDIYEELLRTGLPLSVAQAVEDLIRRTRRSAVWRRVRQRAIARLTERWRNPPLRVDEDANTLGVAPPPPVAMSRKQGQGVIPCASP